jgi:hypothetical protein
MQATGGASNFIEQCSAQDLGPQANWTKAEAELQRNVL